MINSPKKEAKTKRSDLLPINRLFLQLPVYLPVNPTKPD
jgi:hypothetical protein